MAKKSFKDNPALQFISTTEEASRASEQAEPEQLTLEDEATALGVTVEELEEANSEIQIPDGYKLVRVPEGYYFKPMEIRSRRVQTVMLPSLYDRLKTVAKRKGLSVNDYIHTAVENAVIKDELEKRKK